MIVWAVAGVLTLALLGVGGKYFFSICPTSQIFGAMFWHVRTEQKVVALTFDDGPNPPDTNNLLAVLKKHDVRATFFLVGKNLEKFPDVGRAITAGRHAIGNHMYSHSFAAYFSPAVWTKEVAHTQVVIKNITGVVPTVFRPPWLFRLPGQLQKLSVLGLTPVSGVFGSEWEILHPSSTAIARRALQKVQPGAILIFHDGYDAKGGDRRPTVGAIDLLIPELKSRGYSFATVPELVRLKDVT